MSAATSSDDSSLTNNAFVRLVRGTADVFVFLCFSYMLAAMMVQVISRYVLNLGIPGTEETGIFAQCWMALVGMGVAMRMNAHVALDAFVKMLPINVARLLTVGFAIGSIAFLAVVFYGSLTLIRVGHFQTSGALQIPMWIIYLSLPVGCTYFAFEIVLSLFENWNRPVSGPEIVE